MKEDWEREREREVRERGRERERWRDEKKRVSDVVLWLKAKCFMRNES